MQVQDRLQPNSYLQGNFVRYSIVSDLQKRKWINKKKQKKKKTPMVNTTTLAKKYILRIINLEKTTWEEGTIDKRIGKMLYLIKHRKWVIKKTFESNKKRYTTGVDQCKEQPMTVIHDMFNVLMPQPVQQN